MDFTKPIAIIIAGIFGLGMIDRFMDIAPSFQWRINGIFISKNKRPPLNGLTEEGLNGLLLDVGEHLNDDFPAALDHAKDRRLFFLNRPAPRAAFRPPPPSQPPLT